MAEEAQMVNPDVAEEVEEAEMVNPEMIEEEEMAELQAAEENEITKSETTVEEEVAGSLEANTEETGQNDNDIENTDIEFNKDEWIEVVSSYQNNTVIKWPVVGVEDVSDGEGRVPCLIVGKNRIKGIIPLQETGVEPGRNRAFTRRRLMTLVGQEVAFIVLKYTQSERVFVASRKDALKKLAAVTWPKLKENAVVTGVVLRVMRRSLEDGTLRETGAVVDINGIEAFLPVQEVAYGWVDEILERIQPGDKVKVKVLEADREKERVIVSLKRLIPDPWPEAAKRYRKGGEYYSTVTGVMPYGIFTKLEDGVDALCKHLKAGSVKKGDSVLTHVTSIDPERRQVRGIISKVIRTAR